MCELFVVFVSSDSSVFEAAVLSLTLEVDFRGEGAVSLVSALAFVTGTTPLAPIRQIDPCTLYFLVSKLGGAVVCDNSARMM